MSKKAWGREEDTFGFGGFLSLTYVHIETKPCEVVVNQGQYLWELIVVFKHETRRRLRIRHKRGRVVFLDQSSSSSYM